MIFSSRISSVFIAVIKKFLFIGIPVLIIINLGYSFVYNAQHEVIAARIESELKEPVNIIEFQLGTLFRTIHDDLNLIRRSNEFSNYLLDDNNLNYMESARMFVRILISKPDFRQVRYLDINGKEKIRVNRTGSELEIVQKTALQDKASRYYFKSLVNMSEYSLYVSDFDLNMENGEIVLPYEPMIRFAIPVITGNVTRGFLIINYDGTRIFQILNKHGIYRPSSINVGVLDRNHLISMDLLNPNEDFIESFLGTDSSAVKELYQLTTQGENGSFSLGDEIYYYNEIEQPDDFPVVFDDISSTWKIISNFNIKTGLEEDGNFIIKYGFFRYILLALASGLILVILFLNEIKKDEHLLLLASGYISEYTHEGILITDVRQRIIFCNKIFEQTYGYSFNEMSGKTPGSFLKGESKVKIVTNADNGYAWEGNIWDIGKEGTYILKYLRIRTVLNVKKKPVYFIGVYSEPKVLAEKTSGEYVISHQFSGKAMDYLGPVFEQKFQAIDRKAVIVIKFAEINSIKRLISYSEESKFLITINKVFINLVNTKGLVISPALGVVIIAVPILGEKELKVLMNEVDIAISSFRFLEHPGVLLNYISGIAISPEHGTTGKELIDNAFIALEALGKMRKSKYLIYNDNIFDIIKTDRIIREEIDQAFSRGEFNVVYQLQKKTDAPEYTGVEALVRWQSLKIGRVRPDLFVPIMEETDQIKRLGKYILEKVIEEFSDIMNTLPDDFRISLNLSSQEFDDTALVAELVQMIDEKGLSRDKFCFEITETTLVEKLDLTNEIITHLHDNNILVAIDDFGTGYSSLNYLKKLNADKIKIDRIFIRDYPKMDDGRILKAIIKMIKEIGIKIIVEGIETDEQLTFIRENGCDEYQGYLCSRPVPIDEIKKMLS